MNQFKTCPPEAEPDTSLPVKKRLTHSKQKKLKIFSALLLAVTAAAAAAALYPLLSARHNPDRFIKAYVNSAVNRDWKAVYSSIPYIDSPFISYEEFTDFINENPGENPLENAADGSFVIERESTEGQYIYYSVDYIDKDKNWNTAYITVKKTKDGFWKYDEYKIIPNQKLISRAQIYAPAGARLYVDGTEITDMRMKSGIDPSNGKETSYCVFTTDYLFTGVHEITAQKDGCEDYRAQADINAENSFIYVSMNISKDSFSACLENAKLAAETLYRLAAGEQDEADGLNFSSRFGRDGFIELAAQTKKSVCPAAGVRVSDFKITSAQPKSTNKPAAGISYNTSDVIYADFNFEYKYKITNTAENTSQERFGEGYAAVKFVYENSEWVIDDIAARAIF